MKCSERNRNSLFYRRLLVQSLVFPCATLAPISGWLSDASIRASDPIQHPLYLQTIATDVAHRNHSVAGTQHNKTPRRLPKPTATQRAAAQPPATRQTSGEVAASLIGTPIVTDNRADDSTVDRYATNPDLDQFLPRANRGIRATVESAPERERAVAPFADDAPQSPIERAARRLAKIRSTSSVDSTPAKDGRWLQSVTTDSCTHRSQQHLADAYREYRVGAWASAEASAWKALHLIATGIDVADRQTAVSQTSPTAVNDLRNAKLAIVEGREFMTGGASIDFDRLAAIAASHQTPVFQVDLSAGQGLPSGLTSTEATDRYFDYARNKLASLAESQVTAAQALDLLAAIELGRDQQSRLPEETSLCFRRAALQGQPENGSLASRLGMQLADMGLDREAAFTLQHAIDLNGDHDIETAATLAKVVERLGDREAALRLTASLRRQMPQSTPTRRMPEIVELSPDQFAAISPPMNVMASQDLMPHHSVPTRPTSARQSDDRQSTEFAAFRMPRSKQSVAIPSGHAGTPNTLSGRSTQPAGTTHFPEQAATPQRPTSSPVKRFVNKLRFW